MSTENNARFAAACRALRAAGLTQAEIARRLGLSGQSMVSRLALGRVTPTLRTVLAVEALVRKVAP